MSKELVQKVAKYVKNKLLGEPTGHDWFHTERVWRMAKKLQEEEGGDLELVELSALMHELGDDSVFEFSSEKGSLMLSAMMDVLEIENDLKEKIIDTIAAAQFDGENTKRPDTIEACIVRDAKWLDDLGALGIARVFATGGYIKRELHDPNKPMRKRLSFDAQRRTKRQGTSLNYFYEKMLRLPKLMCTKTARTIADRRAKYIQDYIDEFLLEWEGER